MLELSTIQQIAIWILPVLFAITFHEAAHAWVANYFGDSTAKMLGRLSFNPIRHVDLIGTIIVPIAVLLMSNFSFVFGWAKPVPINSSQFKNPRRDLAIATAAGPFSNLLMALFWALCMKIGTLLNLQSSLSLFLLLTGRAGVIINLLLAFLNLLPIPPLDGSRIVSYLLPIRQATTYEKLEPFGLPILILLMFTGILAWLINPLLNWSMSVIRYLFNL